MSDENLIAAPEDLILVTGAAGFIGCRVVKRLLAMGFRNIRCLVRPSSRTVGLRQIAAAEPLAQVDIVTGNLLSTEDCAAAAADACIIYHLAAPSGEKSIPEAFRNAAVTTRNLLDAVVREGKVRRFVNVSSFAVYTNRNKSRWRVLDETCPVEDQPHRRGDAYTFAKVKQDQIVAEYAQSYRLPSVSVRPGYVFGPGGAAISGRVGTPSFGLFLHLGNGNPLPLTYVENCAEALALAGLVPGVDGETFNIVDDDLISSRRFLGQYKRNVKWFPSICVPHFVSYGLCWAWESYSRWSRGQLEPVFNRRVWHAYWKGTNYSNCKAKDLLHWKPRVGMDQALGLHFAACRGDAHHD